MPKIPMRLKDFVAMTLSQEDLILMVVPAKQAGAYEAYVHKALLGHSDTRVRIECLVAKEGFVNEVDAWNWLEQETHGKNSRDYRKLKVVK